MAIHGQNCALHRQDMVQGVDVFAATPDALPFDQRLHVRGNGDVRAHFFGDRPTDIRGREVPGGAWLPCGVGGEEKAYSGADGEETVAYRRKYEFRYHRDEAGGGETVVPEHEQPRWRWRMKEYRLNKDAAAFHRARAQPNPKANLDCVVRVIYTKEDDDVFEGEEDLPMDVDEFDSEDEYADDSMAATVE
ncbi:uncharacterized protein LOC121054294 [Oryza brachyantha]|nr:uncharacterized protein LOC121054294 [Oryza brachyantha]